MTEDFREALDAAGIGAEMHARLRKRIVDILHGNGKIAISEKNEQSKLLISIVADFLDSENLEFSKSVLAAETAIDFSDRREISRLLKFPGSAEESILSAVLHSIGDKPNLADACTQTTPKKMLPKPTASPLSSSFESSFYKVLF